MASNGYRIEHAYTPVKADEGLCQHVDGKGAHGRDKPPSPAPAHSGGENREKGPDGTMALLSAQKDKQCVYEQRKNKEPTYGCGAACRWLIFVFVSSMIGPCCMFTCGC